LNGFFPRVCAGNHRPFDIINRLRVNMIGTPEDSDSRSFDSTPDTLSNMHLVPVSCFQSFFRGFHKFLYNDETVAVSASFKILSPLIILFGCIPLRKVIITLFLSRLFRLFESGVHQQTTRPYLYMALGV